MKKIIIILTILFMFSCGKDYDCTDALGNEIGKKTCAELLEGCETDGLYCVCYNQNCR